MKNLSIVSLTLTLLAILVFACTPKTTTKVTKTDEPKKETPAPKDEGNCPTWNGKSFKDQAMENHVLYRQELEQKNYQLALEYWDKVFSIAPAADGKRDYQYTDGVKIYKGLIEKENNASTKEQYIKRIFELYDKGMECYPAKSTMYQGLKAYDLFYTFPDRVSNEEIYDLFKEVIDTKGNDTPAFVVNPFTSLLVNGYLENKVPKAEAQKYAGKIFDILDRARKKLKDKNDPKWTSKGWDVVESYAPSRLEQMEGVEGFYDCDYYQDKYYADFEAAPTDCDAILATLGRLKRGNCPDSDTKVQALRQALAANCKKPVEASTSCTALAREALQNGRYKTAIGHYQECFEKTDDNERKALYALTIAKIYYAHLKQYSNARRYARRASSFKPNWGDPYILIGKLYASSGPLCGPGRGWKSQIVTWPAIDQWKKAKRLDSSVVGEANKLIARYQQYMPSKEDLHQRLLKEGDSFTVECWIQEKTKVRAAK